MIFYGSVMTNSLVSIGMPVFNGEAYLAEAIESILGQSYKNIELIIADNASTDKTEEIVRLFSSKDDRIRYIRNDSNVGAINNFNFTLSMASGEYFMWAAADDRWDSNWVEVLKDNLCDDVSISFGNIVNIDADGKIVRKYRLLDFSGSRIVRLIGYYLAEDFNGKANIIYGLYRTNDIKSIKMKDVYYNCRFGVDMLFVFDYIQRGPVSVSSESTIYKRINYECGSGKSKRRVSDSLFMINRMRYNLCYSYMLSRYHERVLFMSLFPIKYVKSFILNCTRILRNIISGNEVDNA